MKAVGMTHQGQRKNNEDYFLVDKEENIFVVADGMGGHNAGEVASYLAVNTIREHLANLKDASSRQLEIKKAVEEANQQVYAQSLLKTQQDGMGTTLTAFWIVENTAYIAHVGDSRAYLLRDGGMELITSDHSLVQELVREGSITPSEAEGHPKRNVLTRAVGIQKETIVDTAQLDLKTGDLILLCTDGLTSVISDEEIRGIIKRSSSLNDSCMKLVETARVKNGEDNITAVLILID